MHVASSHMRLHTLLIRLKLGHQKHHGRCKDSVAADDGVRRRILNKHSALCAVTYAGQLVVEQQLWVRQEVKKT